MKLALCLGWEVDLSHSYALHLNKVESHDILNSEIKINQKKLLYACYILYTYTIIGDAYVCMYMIIIFMYPIIVQNTDLAIALHYYLYIYTHTYKVVHWHWES